MTLAKRLPDGQRSQAMVEFALIGPIVLLLLFFIIDFGRGIYYFVTIDNAANEGARTAVRSSAEPGTSATLPRNSEVVGSIQQHTAAVFLSQDCPNGPIDTSTAGSPPPNVGSISLKFRRPPPRSIPTTSLPMRRAASPQSERRPNATPSCRSARRCPAARSIPPTSPCR